MRPTLQVSNNDCLAAALASVLEIPLPLVPVFPRARTGKAQLDATNRWLAQLGYLLLEIRTDKQGRLPISPLSRPTHCIVTVSMPGQVCNHACVGLFTGGELSIVHDPGANGYRNPRSRVLSVAFLVKSAA